VEVKKERRDGTEKEFVMTKTCPICSSPLHKKDAPYYCENPVCPARNIEKLIHFTSRNAMNIEGFGDRIIEDFYNMGYIKNFTDFYHLEKYQEELMELEGFGEKSIDNLLKSIENSKQNSLERFLFGLGIRHVGQKTAKILAAYYKELEALKNASYEELVDIRDIGEIIAKSVYEYFRVEENIEQIEIFKQIGLNMEYLGKVTIDENFANKTFVLTGALEEITREEAKEAIESRGGKTSSSVSKKTSAVIVGKDPGSKYDKALTLEIPIWSESDFIEKIKE
ncbi:MAG: helix-hairpin-helix domain-containing protein, partial [Bacilli bacterium]|nr:helix-hairpin-helix domain-containing protein [Bacilli bacterium]